MLLERGRESATGLVLGDGTPLSDLIDFDKYEVSMRLLNDPEVHRLELKHLFGRAWNLLGHESEIPSPGDYIMRYIGEDPVIVTRDRDGEINVLLNVCAHRGMMICRSEGGKGTQFRCPYHGWTFSNTGKFLGAPVAPQQMHGTLRSKEELGLVRARTDSYVGMIFATWDPAAPSLSDYLGDIKWYLDLMFGRTEDGIEVLGPPQRFIIKANWKCAGEQHAGDGYHNLTLHQSLQELNAMSGSEENPVAMAGLNVSANGHGLRCIDTREPFINALKGRGIDPDMPPLEKLRFNPPPGLTPDQVPALAGRFDEAQLRVLADFAPQVGGLFPNVGTFAVPFPMPDGMSALLSWHAFVPRGPEHFEFFNWYLVEKSASAEMRRRMSRTSNLSFGISGFVESDDADTWPQMTQAARGYMGSQQKLRYQALLGERKPDDWPGGGHVYAGFGKDDNQWNWWLRYADFMSGRPW
jgi:phenylpropionate dioxygenase-like ring-hydroxylating dioxygenase large terminal subunit